MPLLLDLFMDGRCRLEERVTRRLPLSELTHAFDLVKQREVKRTGILYESPITGSADCAGAAGRA